MSGPKGPRRTPFALTGPCADCPFRSDKPFPLGRARRASIADDLMSGSEFSCHKTLDYSDGTGRATAGTKWCGGALATLEAQGTPNQSMRLGERLGLYDPAGVDLESPVHPTLAEWIEADPEK